MLSPENQAIVRRHLEAENQHRMEETLATLTEDCVFEDRALGRTYHGREGARAYYRLWWDAFGVTVMPSGARHVTTDGVLISEAGYRGAHRGEFLGIPPTGRDIELRFVVFVTFRDGLMSGERFYYDLTGLLRQLGVTTIPSLDEENHKDTKRTEDPQS
ncbi:MAG TPA: ester cyclase [Dehalococcoidia bacterium]|nr:ester cyclase [Dehalococcoidia bacterium]